VVVRDAEQEHGTNLKLGILRTKIYIMSTMNCEIWKIIPGYENYQVSNYGRVKSTRKVLKANYRPTGYVHAQLTVDGKNKAIPIHRLVMKAFVGISNLDVDHINSIKDDNRLENLRYVTSRQNNLYKENTKGYHYCKSTGKWKSEASINGRKKFLGRFVTEEEAYQAYHNAIKYSINKNSKGEHI